MKKLPELPESPTYSIHLSTEEEDNDKILEIRNLAAAVVLLKRGMQSKTKNLAQNSVCFEYFLLILQFVCFNLGLLRYLRALFSLLLGMRRKKVKKKKEIGKIRYFSSTSNGRPRFCVVNQV